MIKLEAHRGICTRYPENTLSAFKGAKAEGYDMIELDPKFTRDGKCVILHDRTLNRTARNKDGSPLSKETKIAEITLSEALSYDYGVWFSDEYKGEKMPALKDVLVLAKENNIPLKFDNVLSSFPDDLLLAFFDEVEKESAENFVEITASKPGYLEKVIKRFPSMNIHYDGDYDEESLKKVSSLVPKDRLTIWLPVEKKSWLPYESATEEDVNRVKKYGKCGIWIVHAAGQLEKCVALGADIIETDGFATPEDLKKLILKEGK